MERGDLIRMKDAVDGWHRRRAEKHGKLYIFMCRDGISGDIIEAKSIITGRVVTLMEDSIEEFTYVVEG